MMKSLAIGLILAGHLVAGLAGCAAIDPEAVSDSPRMTVGSGTPVPVAAETAAVATATADAADDPEIWIDPRDRHRGVIFGTDKNAGLYVYDLDGKVRTFLNEGELNNVDLRDGFIVDGKSQVLVAASDRTRGGAALFLMDPDSLAIRKWADIAVPISEAYGLCLGRRGPDYLMVIVGVQGDVKQWVVTSEGGVAKAREERSFALGSQGEGCVIDDTAGQLYVGEEAIGVWRYGLSGEGRVQIGATDGVRLTADVEGLTLIPDGDARYLIASSQGDSAFAVWRINQAEPAYVGRFSPVAANGVDGVTGTDGVAAVGGPAGPYAQGFLVMQDDVDTEGEAVSSTRERQNFKMVDWSAVKTALGIAP